MIKFIASDIDGTIIGENNFIPQKNLEVIDKISSNSDLTFTVCTGKTYSIFKNTCSKLKAKYGIFGNGNQIVDLSSGKEIYKLTLAKEDVLGLIDFSKKNNLHIHLYTEDKIVTENLKYMDLRNYTLCKNNFFDSNLKFEIVNNIENYMKNNSEEVFQLIISSDLSLEKDKKELLANPNISLSHIKKRGIYKDLIINKEYEYLCISAQNTDKAYAIQYLIDYLKINQDDVMTIGDNLNDINMVRGCENGVAISNAYEEVKNVCKYLTQNDVNNGGFAEAVYKFIKFNDIT